MKPQIVSKLRIVLNMEIRHKEIVIDEKNPFANCKLEREQYANVLTDIVKTYADGFVLAINNEWGTGKTTFIKMWQQDLKNKDFQTIYFNAWENDFDNNPLVALMAELKTLDNAKNNETFKHVLEKGAILLKNVLPALLKSILKKYIDVEEVTDAIENTTKGVTEIFENEIDGYINKKETVSVFRKELENFIKETGGGSKPLIFIIDELDRCRPDYAVEVLEQVKHFFSVSGIVFVLSIDKKHLASSIKGFYGSEDINTDEYLRRFIDLEYSIAKPSNRLFCRYLYSYYSFDDLGIYTDRRGKYDGFSEDVNIPLEMAILLFDKSNITLRQQEKMFAQVRLVLSFIEAKYHILSPLIFVLIYFKTMKNQLYEGLKDQSYNVQTLCNTFEDLFSDDLMNKKNFNLFFIEALLLYYYNNNKEYRNRERFFELNAYEKRIRLIKSNFVNEVGEFGLVGCLNHIYDQWNIKDLNLNYLLNRIDLLEPINK